MKKNLPLFATFLLATMVFLFSCASDSEISSAIKITYDDDQEQLLPFSDEEYSILSKSLDIPNAIIDYRVTLPEHSGGKTTSIDNVKATLGRVLFYDKELSIDRTVSCASCHHPDKAFSDDVAFSEGVDGHLTDRNSIAIGSFLSVTNHYGGTSTSNDLFWDGRADNFTQQMNQTFTNPKEMGISLSELSDRVKEKDYYDILFRKVYTNGVISSTRVIDALEEFMSSFHSTHAFFDIALNQMGPNTSINKDFIKFSLEQNKGKALFNSKCKSCHGFSLTTKTSQTISFANNGLDINYEDEGMGELFPFSSNNGKFKIPSLRNIEVTGPFMHDGRFETLEEVVDFYNDGIQPHENLNTRLKDENGDPVKMNLTEDDKMALVSFLKTLTDNSFISAAKYSDPFK